MHVFNYLPVVTNCVGCGRRCISKYYYNLIENKFQLKVNNNRYTAK